MRLLGPNRRPLVVAIASVSAVTGLLVLGSALRDAQQPRQPRRAPHFRSFDRDLFKTSLAKVADGGEVGPRDGAEQESYDNRAYPALVIDPAQQLTAAAAAAAINRRPGGKSANWQELGPAGVPASGLVASESTGGSVGVLFSGLYDGHRDFAGVPRQRLQDLHRRRRRRRVGSRQRARGAAELASLRQRHRVERDWFDCLRSDRSVRPDALRWNG